VEEPTAGHATGIVTTPTVSRPSHHTESCRTRKAFSEVTSDLVSGCFGRWWPQPRAFVGPQETQAQERATTRYSQTSHFASSDNFMKGNDVCFFHARGEKCRDIMHPGCCPYSHALHPTPLGVVTRLNSTSPRRSRQRRKCGRREQNKTKQLEHATPAVVALLGGCRQDTCHKDTSPAEDEPHEADIAEKERCDAGSSFDN